MSLRLGVGIAAAVAALVVTGCGRDDDSIGNVRASLSGSVTSAGSTSSDGFMTLPSGVAVKLTRARLKFASVGVSHHGSEVGDDHGGHGAEPGDDHGGGLEPGDDNGGSGEVEMHGSDDSLDLLSDDSMRLSCSSGCGVAGGEVTGVEMRLVRLTLAGIIESDGVSRHFKLDVRLRSERTLRITLQERIPGSGSGQVVSLKVKLALPAGMLDSIDWAQLAADGTLDLESVAAAAAKEWLLSQVESTQLQVSVEQQAR